jgi:UDP-3-O-acyl N-acetylglucosamine deacetylase
VRISGYRSQRTLNRPASVRGVGLVSGTPVHLRFLPAAANTGVVFVRTDLPFRSETPALADQVTGTARRTTIGPDDSGVTLVEHVLGALAGLRIDNCRVELDAPEPPGLDGSAGEFVAAIRAAGVALQPARRAVWTPTEPITVAERGATITLYPSDPGDTGLKATYALDYGPRSPIARQTVTTELTPASVARDLAHCRTFLLDSEAAGLRRQGVGRHLTASELLVFGPRGPIDNTLRHADEPARHKVLDLVGDLALCGAGVSGHIVAYRSGHALNVALAQELLARVALCEAATAAPETSEAPDVIHPTRGFLPRRPRRQEAA